MARQDIKHSYRNYRLGLLWTLAEPFGLAIMMWAVFSFVLSGREESIGLDPFIVYIITGLLPFQWLSQSIRKGPKVFRKYGGILVFSPLPVWIWPFRGVMTGGAEFLMSLPVVFALILLFDAPLTWGVLLLPVAVVLQIVLCTGAAILGAALALRLPDIERLTSIIVRMLFWTSPILWASRNFPEWLQPWLYLNPFQLILDLYRAAVWPDHLGSWQDWLLSLAVIAAVFAAGALLLRARVQDVRRLD
jgi:ABC-2 type transport system permease protein